MAKRPLMPEEAKDFAVLCFARFMRPGQVMEAIKDRYGLDIDRRLIQNYDPTVTKGYQLGKKRKQLFEVTRERFLKELEDIPIASRAVRLQQLQHHYVTAIDRNNLGMGLRILEQAAKEAGGVHTNERHVHMSGKVQVEDVTDEEMRGTIAAAIATALQERKDALQPPTDTRH